MRLRDLLRHLYVLMPVLDDRKHYWVGEAEVEKLVRHASEWLGPHPRKEWIAQRYLKHRRSLARLALERLTDDRAEETAEDGPLERGADREAELEKPVALNERRMDIVSELVAKLGVKTVVDLGCGEGRLLSRLLELGWTSPSPRSSARPSASISSACRRGSARVSSFCTGRSSIATIACKDSMPRRLSRSSSISMRRALRHSSACSSRRLAQRS